MATTRGRSFGASLMPEQLIVKLRHSPHMAPEASRSLTAWAGFVSICGATPGETPDSGR